MLCPLTRNNCIAEDCAFWDHGLDCCAVVSIASLLHSIYQTPKGDLSASD